ncbi:MAG: hypothetical protein JXJ30_08010 [Halothiobacillaceae bacterium]|nr:hypothetical protein [Halothiobacillaceae bacterium]HER34987.1 hypothetical protein [Halothiobacillaceae bacterium]
MALPENWSDYLLEHPLPVRRAIHEGMVGELRSETPDFPRLVGWLRRDPAASSMVLGAAAGRQREHHRSAPHNLEHALSLLGSDWARTRLADLPIVEDTLTQPAQRSGYLAASSRALRAARLTERWLVERRETGVEMVAIAALLHNLVELALWRDDPALARLALAQARNSLVQTVGQTRADSAADRDLPDRFSLGRAFEVTLASVGIDLGALETTLTERYYLPVMLLAEQASVPVLGAHHQAILVLARRLAFASESGWYHPLIRHLIEQLSVQLHRSPTACWQLTVEQSLRDAHEFADIPLYHPAHMLVEHADGRERCWPPPADYDLRAAGSGVSSNETTRDPARRWGDMIRQLATLDGVLEIALYGQASESRADRRFHWCRRDGERELPGSIDLDASPLLSRLQARLEPLTVDTDNLDRLGGYLDATLARAARGRLIIVPLAVNGALVSTLCCRGNASLSSETVLEVLELHPPMTSDD